MMTRTRRQRIITLRCGRVGSCENRGARFEYRGQNIGVCVQLAQAAGWTFDVVKVNDRLYVEDVICPRCNSLDE